MPKSNVNTSFPKYKDVKWKKQANLCLLKPISIVFQIVIGSVVEFQRWWVLKSKIFGQESTYLKKEKKSIAENKLVQKLKLENTVFNKKKGLIN